MNGTDRQKRLVACESKYDQIEPIIILSEKSNGAFKGPRLLAN